MNDDFAKDIENDGPSLPDKSPTKDTGDDFDPNAPIKKTSEDDDDFDPSAPIEETSEDDDDFDPNEQSKIDSIGDDLNNPTNNVDEQTEEAAKETAILKRLNIEKEAIDKKIEELREKEAEMAKDIVKEREIRDSMVLGDNPVSPELAKKDADTIYAMGQALEDNRIEFIELGDEIKDYKSVSSQIGIMNQLEEKIASSDNPEQIAHYREMQEKLKTRIEKSKLDIEN